MRQLNRIIPLVISAAVIAALPGLARAAGPTDSVRYWDRSGDSKLRLDIRGDRVIDIRFRGDSVCRRANGDRVEPWYGTGVISFFNDTNLNGSGGFRSHQEYRRRKFVRNVVGNIDTREATVGIHYRAPVKRDGPNVASCRTGEVAFKLQRVG